jgi:hypothetical protein
MAICNCYQGGDIHDVAANACIRHLLLHNKLCHDLVSENNNIYYTKAFLTPELSQPAFEVFSGAVVIFRLN